MSVSAALMSSNNPAWCTPEVILERVRKLGPISLDPCSNPQSIVGAETEWSIEEGDNGLDANWDGYGLVYVNPPYGREIGAWMRQCWTQYKCRDVEIVALVPARTDARWWHDTVPHVAAFCFVKGRLRFLGAPASAPFPSAVLYFGNRPEAFRDAFADLGYLIVA